MSDIKSIVQKHSDKFQPDQLERLMLTSALIDALRSPVRESAPVIPPPKAWVLPRLGDKVKCITEVKGMATPLTVGGVYAVAGFASMTDPDVPPTALASPDSCYIHSTIALWIKTKDETRWIVPLKCFEPVD